MSYGPRTHGGGVRQQHLDLAPGRDLVGRRDLRVCLVFGRSPKTPLDDVESEKGEGYKEKAMLLSTTRTKGKEQKIY